MTIDHLAQTSSLELQPNHPQPSTPLATPSITWLWPGRIPQGKLTLLDGAPNCGTTLFALTLAACISSGHPLPDGTPCTQGNILFIAPHDHVLDTLAPRLLAAGAALDHILSLTHVSDPTPNAPEQSRPFSLSHDLALLESTIITANVVLLILDPYTALPGWRRALPALIDLAQRTHCAILLIRSLSRAPSDPLHPQCPASPVLTAARSHLLLAPDPSDDRHCLLLTPKHSLCAAPAILAYTITSTQRDIPTIIWLPAPDPTHLRRLSTGPICSPHRHAILHFLRQQPTPCHIKDILSATSYDYEPGRKMLLRMSQAHELISLGRGLYTTSNHPCLAHLTNNSQLPSPTSPVPVPNVPAVPGDSSTPTKQNDASVGTSAEPTECHPSFGHPVGTVPCACPDEGSGPSPISQPSTGSNDSQKDIFARMIARNKEAHAQIQARLVASGYPMPTIPLTNVPCPNLNLTTEENTKPALTSPTPNEQSDDNYILPQSFTPLGTQDLSQETF